MSNFIILFLRKLLRYLDGNILPDKLDLEKVALIKGIEKDKLIDEHYLELDLIPKLGLNNESLHEFPIELMNHTGKGLFIWQYPNQLSQYLSFLSNLPINNFIEIGCRWGGTFILTYEYLLRFNQNLIADCIDIVESRSLRNYVNQNKNINYRILDSNQQKFKELYNKSHFDLVFIDGDHSFNGCFSDFNFFESRAEILVFHDIVSDVCPGVVLTWKIVKESKKYEIFEFVSQYEEVQNRTKCNYLGIGVAIKKESKFLNYVNKRSNC